ncbi:unnamed protein product [Angiostrongylus costaricensis]|uniref:Methyltransf_11 domain-containing protein n=1 Tax=Angiostrongylus costaricensis TaxID=334426 RepID=A0A158PE03_ANGCS|nr:unnamed protein product [Angiostrongylus costaricensis]
MAGMPSSHSTAQLLSAISSLAEVHMSARRLNEDIRGLLEQIETVEKLPQSINLCQIDGWRSRLLSKIRMEISKLEEAYRHVVGSQWSELLRTIRRDVPSVSSISFTFPSDMQLVNDFYTEAQQVALNNDLFATDFRFHIPVTPLNVEKAISRSPLPVHLLNSAAGGLPYPVCGFCIRIGMLFFRMCGDCCWQKQTLNNVDQAASRCEAVLKSSKCKADRVVSAFPYDSKFVKILLKDVHIMAIGDSIMRGIYKDLIAMLHGDELVKDINLKSKTESSVMKVDIERAFLEMSSTGEFPDVLLINSCLWDITRASMMIRRLRLMMPATTQVIWLNMPWPIPVDTPSLVNRVDNFNTRHLSRMLVVDANFRASQLFRAAGYDVLDLAFYMRNQALYSYRSLVFRSRTVASAEEACSSDMWRNWAARSLVESDISTLADSRSAHGSFPEIIQRKIREGVLHEMKDKNLNLDASTPMSQALRSCLTNVDSLLDILLADTYYAVHLLESTKRAKAFPKVAEYTKSGLNQEVTLLADEDPIAVTKGRKRPRGTVG